MYKWFYTGCDVNATKGMVMKMKKRITASLLTLATVTASAIGLSGCGGSNKTLKWVQLGEVPSRGEEVLEKINEIVEPELGLKLEIEYIDTASFAEKAKMKMAAGEDFDIIWAGYLNDYQTAVSLEGLMDITDMLDNIEMKDGTKAKMSDAVEDYFLDAAKVDDRIYGVPNMQVVSNPLTYKVRKSIADECGLNLDELEKKAYAVTDLESCKSYMDMLTDEMAKVKAKRPDVYVTNPSTNPAFRNVYEEIIGGVGIRKDGSSSEVVNIKDTEEFKYGVDKTREWFEKGYIRSDIASKGNALTSTDEENQHAFIQTTWKPGQEQSDAKDAGEDVVYSRIENPYVSRTNPIATMLAVGQNSKHPEEAVKLIYMLNSNKELYNLIVWGIEGTDYTKNDDGTVTKIENSGYDESYDSGWRFGNQFNAFVAEGQEITVWEETKKMNDTAIKSPAMGFVPNTESITTEIANITNVNSEYKAKMEFGTMPREEYWDEYMNKLETAGIGKVRDEIQRQYDEFLKTK